MNEYNQDNHERNTGAPEEGRTPEQPRDKANIYPPNPSCQPEESAPAERPLSGWNRGHETSGENRYPENTYSRNNAPERPNIAQNARVGYYYTPGEGWQRNAPSASPAPRKYEWNFRDYDELASRSAKRKGRRGPVVFAACFLAFIVICTAVSAGYSIMNGTGGIASDSNNPWEYSRPSSNSSGTRPDTGESASLELSGKPQVSEASAPTGGKLTIPQIAKLVTPSVVGVSAYQGSRYYDPVSMGSGIIMTSNGYIITNAHVVLGATRFKVQLYDNTPYDATLVGADASTDLAILKINATGLSAAAFGNSDEIEVGEPVVAIGNPSGIDLAGSVTNGIISAINRKVSTGNYSFRYIQTNAAINPGNSGGALVNEFGQVIGINSSKIVATGYEGIGFAIPMSDAKPILDDIVANGKVTGRVMLGITCIPVDDVDAKNFGIPPGLEIQDISPDSDIANYDVQSGDILTHIDNQPVYSLSDVQGILQGHKAGDSVTLRLFRRVTTVDDIEFEVTVRLIEN